MNIPDYIMDERADEGIDVIDYYDQLYWETPITQSDCCGEPISDIQSLMVETNMLPAVCPKCNTECKFDVITGSPNHPLLINKI